MNEKLQQAIMATRGGQPTKAQLLLAEVLKDDPNETQAWFLLSNLVDSEQKKIAYLGKVIALDPEHAMAKKALLRLQNKGVGDESVATETETAVFSEETPSQETALETPAISDEPTDYLTQEKGDTVPEWLAEEEGIPWEQGAPVEIKDTSDSELDEKLEVPDWLQEEVSETWVEDQVVNDETTTTIDQQSELKLTEVASQDTRTPDNTRGKQQAFLTRVLYALVVVAVVIFIILLYIIWKTL